MMKQTFFAAQWINGVDNNIVILVGLVAILLIAVIALEIKLQRKSTEKADDRMIASNGDVAQADDGAMIAAITAAIQASNDNATVAAITAAIATAMAEEGYTGGFRVVSFKRVGTVTNRRKF